MQRGRPMSANMRLLRLRSFPIAAQRSHQVMLSCNILAAKSSSGWAGSTQLTRALSSRVTAKAVAPDIPPLPTARWLADLRARIGKCIIFGCSPLQVSEAAVVTRALATEWRQLTAGSEGYLTGQRRGLEGQQVVWGEMDSFVCVSKRASCQQAFAPSC